MNQAESQEKFAEYSREFERYINTLRQEWLTKHRIKFGNVVYETMNQEERERVNSVIRSWGVYITPLAESWWKERGYGMTWPEDDTEPVEIFPLKAS